jgi:methionyl-tRNA formyltransferase
VTDFQPAEPPADIRRVSFLGTPPASVPSLRALVAAGFDVPLVISQPDRRRGRGSGLTPSPVKQAALDLGLAVDDDPRALLAVDDLDLAVVVAYGRILGRDLLAAVAMVNVHFSILPRWRGAAPVERAILAGDARSGVSIMRLTEGLDEGPVYSCVEVAIGPNETAGELTTRLAELGAGLLIDTIRDGLKAPVDQQGEVTYARKLERSEFRLDFAESAVDLNRRTRIGRCWTTFRGRRLGIEEARPVERSGAPGRLQLVERDELADDVDDGQTGPVVVVGAGDQSLALLRVKPEGRRAMTGLDWWHGTRPNVGESLGL